jgi:hypothetical protein
MPVHVNASSVINGLAAVQKKLPDNIKQAVELACLKVEADAKKNCPVGTIDAGQLRASLTHEVKSDDKGASGSVGSNLFYAPFIHQGTGLYAIEGHGRKEVPWTYQTADGEFHSTEGTQPTPFLQDAIEANRDAILQLFKGVLDKE